MIINPAFLGAFCLLGAFFLSKTKQNLTHWSFSLYNTLCDMQSSFWPALSISLTQPTCPLAHAMWRGGPKWTSNASSWAPLDIISFTTSTLPERDVKVLLSVKVYDSVWLVEFVVTLYAGLMERRGSESCEGRVHLGSVVQKHLGALQAARSTGVTQRSATMDGPYIHLEEPETQLHFILFII